MYKFKSSPYLNIKKKVVNYTSLKFQCINLEKDLFNFINLIRREPSKIIENFKEVQQDPNYNNNFETQQIFNFINNLTKNNISLPPLIEKKEISKISLDLLNYLINIKKFEGRIKYNKLDEEYINFKIRAAPYGRIRGKYYEAIVLDSTNLLEIISYIMKDIKGRNVLFNDKIKYIGIACGFFENINDNKNNLYNNAQKNKICTIIDMVQDFELNDMTINNNAQNNSNYNNIKNKIKTPEIFMRIKTIFKDKDQLMINRKNTEKSLSVDKTDRMKRYQKLKKDNYDEELNKSSDTKRITVNKSPLLSNNKNYMKTFSSRFYLRKANTNRSKPPIIIYNSNNRNKNKNKNKIEKLPSFTNISYKNKNNKIENNNIDETNNIYRNNSVYFSSQFNFTKKKQKPNNNNYNDNNSSAKREINSVSFSRNKSSKKKLNREEKIELLKQINKASRDKSNKDRKTKSNLKSDDESKSASFTTKKNISNDISFSELISYDNDKKLKEEKEMKNLKNQIKNEIKKEIKEAKEEIKKELVNKILYSTNRNNIKPNYPNLKLKLPLDNNMNINDNTYDYGIINNSNTNPSIDGKTIDVNTNRSISSIDIFFPPINKTMTSNNNNDNIPGIKSYIEMNDNNNHRKDNIIMKKLVKLYNVMNKREIDNKQIYNNLSFNNQKNKNIYYKTPFLNNRIYGKNNKEQNYIYNNYKKNNILKTNNKIIKIDHNFDNQNLIINNFKSISPKRRNNIPRLPFRKIIVKNNFNNAPKNEKVSYEKIIKIPKKIINDVNYLDNNNIIINNRTNNIVYIKQISPIRNANYSGRRIYGNKTNYFNKLNQNNQ